ncbi:MAG: MBL fold metallo-hydrolase [Myxococcales bacterium]|nr:MBL fold metallo-hydrolase [Myxococcales bacterium]
MRRDDPTTASEPPSDRVYDGVGVIARGWLHSNTVVLPGPAPAIIDTGYVTGVEELIDRVEALGGFPIASLATVLLTHVHSDHAGGCAELQRRAPARTWAHPDCAALVRDWDPRRLWLEGMGQRMPRFRIDDALTPGERVTAGGIEWELIDAPGHAVGGLCFYARARKLLISGDALWRDGFGILNIPLEGPETIALTRRTLDVLSTLDVELVIPGHGRPFRDFQAAIARARRRLADYVEAPEQTARRNLRASLAFWLLANPGVPRAALERLLRDAPFPAGPVAPLIAALTSSGVLVERDDRVYPGARLRRLD